MKLSLAVVLATTAVVLLFAATASVHALNCDVSASCSGHATSVSEQLYPNGTAFCKCLCRAQWGNADCGYCPSIYDSAGSADCDVCAAGRGRYPTCDEGCNNAQDCNGRAVADPTNPARPCVCQCANAWAGAQCETCPAGVNIGMNCGACLPGYTGYPACSLKCTAANCSYHSTSVAGTSATGCTCSCRNSWTGGKCETCPDFWNSDPDCVTCLPGYSGPNCQTRVCDVRVDCSDHALAVSGNPGSCVCQCRNQWGGAKCETCPAGINAATDCDRCINGHGPAVPVCEPACSNMVDCSAHAATVGGYRPNCTCNCANKWTVADRCQTCPDPYAGSDCGQCKATFNGYPDCALACTVAANCSGHAGSVTGNSITQCSCNCRNRWSGADCSTCAAKYDLSNDCGSCAAGYDQASFPQCYRSCTVALDCSGHATSVTGNVNSGCVCACAGQWGGNECQNCPSGINATVDPANTAPTSLGCDRCQHGWGHFPSCVPLCNDADDCSGNGAADGIDGNCTCHCRNEWQGDFCDVCGTFYNRSDDCGSCVAGAQGYPTCSRDCDITLDCNGNGQSVIGTSLTGCTCTCRNQWGGAKCATCPARYSAQNDCGSCNAVEGYGGDYPNCFSMCTNSVDCNGRASAAWGLRPNCTCNCSQRWTGAACDICPSNYVRDANQCEACAPGFGGPPSCSPVCTLNEDCGGALHAVSVSGFRGAAAGGCQCVCRANWTASSNCSACPSQYDASAGCDRCAAGRVDYPRCAEQCTDEADCSGNGVAYGDRHTGCRCACRNRWDRASNCSTCAPQYNETLDCGRCSANYTYYPYCFRRCTVEQDCSGEAHAVSVRGHYGVGCACQCRAAWAGPRCQFCSSRHNASDDCASCRVVALNFTFPRCYIGCGESGARCPLSGVRRKVNDVALAQCRCDCPAWATAAPALTTTSASATTADATSASSSTTITTTSLPLPPTTSISSAAENVTSASFSTLAETTTVLATTTASETTSTAMDSSSSSTTTTTPIVTEATPPPSNDNGTCRPSYTCARGFSMSSNCSYYSTACSTVADCNGNAISTAGSLMTGCSCSCRNSWAGARCSHCPVEYNSYRDCRGCSATHSGSWPTCYLRCTSGANCTGRAWHVTGNYDPSGPGCRCYCANGYTGERCETCPFGFNAYPSCSSCISGWGGYPRCSPRCSAVANCSGRADFATGTWATGCTCYCRNKWTGGKCEMCPVGYDSNADCGACDTGYGGYPQCSPLCTSEVDCNGHAASVSGILRSGCTCNCRSAWRGATCSACPARTNASDDCSSCEAGNHGYPSCVRTCTIAGDCSGNAVNVTGDGTVAGCTCQCRNQWRGPRCDQCSYQFNASNDCGTCAAGFLPRPAFPICLGACNITKVCSGHATSVSGDTSHGCVCKCRNGWTGSSCNICPFTMKGADCDQCADNFLGVVPNCYRQCDVSDCGGDSHASSASGTLSYTTRCFCSCRVDTAWYGSRCQYCDFRFFNAQCNGCNSPEFIASPAFPTCARACTTVRDCSDHAYTVSGDESTGCACSCSHQWAGPSCSTCPALYLQSTCDQCLPGFEEYPLCYRTCTLDDCGGVAHALSASGNVQQGCICSCRNQWGGPTCSVCDSVYVQPSCGSCRPGLFNYPACNRDCTSNQDCNGHAASVTGTTQAATMGPECTCSCANKWQGDRCDVCPGNIDPEKDCAICKPGYDQSSFPQCYPACTAAEDCSNHASSVAGNRRDGCQCQCLNAWAPPACQSCPYGIDASLSNCGTCSTGFTGYPRCTRDCSFADCDSHAVEVSGDTASGCDCKCRNYWNTSSSGSSSSSSVDQHRIQCDLCPDQFNPATDCATCNVGFTGTPPDCTRPCSLSIDCFDRATTVRGDWPECQCSCTNKWSPPRCHFCPWPFDARRNCNDCLPGFDNFPTCDPTCTVERNCSGRATFVERVSSSVSSSSSSSAGVAWACVCHCRNLWSGPDCGVCPPSADPLQDCLPWGLTTTTTTAAAAAATTSSSPSVQTTTSSTSSATEAAMTTAMTNSESTLAPSLTSTSPPLQTTAAPLSPPSPTPSPSLSTPAPATTPAPPERGRCRRHLVFSVSVSAQPDLPSTTLPTAVSAVIKDVTQLLGDSTCSGSSSTTTPSVQRVELIGNRTVQRWNFSLDVLVQGPERVLGSSGFCSQVSRTAACLSSSSSSLSVAASLSSSCRFFPSTRAVLMPAFSSTFAKDAASSSSSSCTVSPVAESNASACDGFSGSLCPAALLKLDKTRFTSEPLPQEAFCESFPCVIVAAAGGGFILLVVIILLVRKYGSVNMASFGRANLMEVTDDNSPVRNQRGFNNFYQFADESLLQADRGFDDDEGAEEELLLANKFKSSSGGEDFFLPPVPAAAAGAAASGGGGMAAALSALSPTAEETEEDDFLPAVPESGELSRREQMMQDI